MGYKRIREDLALFPNVQVQSIVSISFNQLTVRVRKVPLFGGFISTCLYFAQPLIYLLNIFYFRAIFRMMGKFDLALCNNGGYPAAWGCLAALIASKSVNIKARVLLVHHAATSPGIFMGWFERLVDRQVERSATAIVCVSNATRCALLQKRYFNEENVRFRVIGNAANYCSTTGTKANLRGLLGSFSGFLIGILGRVERYKGQEDLIFALARLPSAIRDQIKVLIIGAGSEGDVSHLKRLAATLNISESVYFAGYIPGNSRSIVVQLDLLVMATRSFEGFGLTVAEAILERVPIIATRVGAIPEFVRPEHGVIIEPCCPGDLALAIESFVMHSGKWRERASLAPQDPKLLGATMADEYLCLFNELISLAH